jgi:1-deoxy-D-xylulose-5-phosphate reductoisomerase
VQTLTILGSTGSIGRQTLEVVRKANERFNIYALAAGQNVALMEEQIREFQPVLAVIMEEKAASELKDRIKDLQVRVAVGMEGMLEAVVHPSVTKIVTAVSGRIGLEPTLAALQAKKTIALANKETLVAAGDLVMETARKNGCNILPVDSEHSAIFQSLNGENKKQTYKIILTASGGPFRGKKRSELLKITPADALKHPNWSMGRKITIDSSTLVNKGLEVMEAAWLFDMSLDQIQVVVHPQSIIHSMVEYVDGSVIAQMGVPDMKLPIQYALFYPDRLPLLQGERVDFIRQKQLTFEEPDMDTFLGLKLGFEAGRIGGSMPTVYNAANEWAVAAFLRGEIGFLTIMDIIQEAMHHHQVIQNPSLNEILNTEQQTYDFVRGFTESGL